MEKVTLCRICMCSIEPDLCEDCSGRNREIENLRRELEELRLEISDLKEKLDSLRANIS